MTRALEVFTVAHGRLRLRVRLLPTTHDAHREYHRGRRCRKGHVHAYMVPASRRTVRHSATVVLGGNGRLTELIPHDVTHAVMHRLVCVHRDTDEPLATLVGIFTDRVIGRLRRLGYEV